MCFFLINPMLQSIFTAVLGNKSLSQYSAENQPFAQVGSWKLHLGSSSKEPVVLFVAKTSSPDSTTLRREALALQKLRHPLVLPVVEPLVEERGTMVFVTRQIVGSLSDFVAKNGRLSVLEIKTGILNIVGALEFLHGAGIGHFNIEPESIFVAPNGRWLLGGFSKSENVGSARISSDHGIFCSPELKSGKAVLESDMFSLGVLLWWLLTGRQDSGFMSSGARTTQEGLVDGNTLRVIQALTDPNPSRRLRPVLLLVDPWLNDSASQNLLFLDGFAEKNDTQKSEFLKNFQVEPINGGPFSDPGLLKRRVLPSLSQSLGNAKTWHAVLAVMLPLLKVAAFEQPPDTCVPWFSPIWSQLRPLFTATEIKLDTVLLIVAELELLSGLVTPQEVGLVLFPFVLKCLEIPEETLLVRVLHCLKGVVSHCEKRLKSGGNGRGVAPNQPPTVAVLPKVLALLVGPHPAMVKGEALLCLTGIIGDLDKAGIDAVIAGLERMGPAFAAGACGSFKVSGTNDHLPGGPFIRLISEIGKSQGVRPTAQKLLPLLIPVIVEDGLVWETYHELSSLINKMLKTVQETREKEMRSKAQQMAREALDTREIPKPPNKEKMNGFDLFFDDNGRGPGTNFVVNHIEQRDAVKEKHTSQTNWPTVPASQAQEVRDLFAGVGSTTNDLLGTVTARPAGETNGVSNSIFPAPSIGFTDFKPRPDDPFADLMTGRV